MCGVDGTFCGCDAMSKKLTVYLSEEEFAKKPHSDQMRMIYSSLLDLQGRTQWRWKQILGVGAAAGFVGGLLREKALPIFMKLF